MVQRRPRRCEGKKLVFLCARFLPGDAFLDSFRVGLLDGKPSVIQRSLLVLDKVDPSLFFTPGNAIGFGKNA